MKSHSLRIQNTKTNEWVKETTFGEANHTFDWHQAFVFQSELKADSALEILTETYGETYIIVAEKNRTLSEVAC